jgi:hypothetical protein
MHNITGILKRLERIITECDLIKNELQPTNEQGGLEDKRSKVQDLSQKVKVNEEESSQQTSADQFNITIKKSDNSLFSQNFQGGRNPVSLWFNAAGMAGFSITDTDHYVCNDTNELNSHKLKFTNDMIFFIGYSNSEKLFLTSIKSSSGTSTSTDKTIFYCRTYTITKSTIIIENDGIFNTELGDGCLQLWFNEHDKTSGLFLIQSNNVKKRFTCSHMTIEETATLSEEFKRMDPLTQVKIRSITIDAREYPRKVALKKLNNCDVNLTYDVNQ